MNVTEMCHRVFAVQSLLQGYVAFNTVRWMRYLCIVAVVQSTRYVCALYSLTLHPFFLNWVSTHLGSRHQHASLTFKLAFDSNNNHRQVYVKIGNQVCSVCSLQHLLRHLVLHGHTHFATYMVLVLMSRCIVHGIGVAGIVVRCNKRHTMISYVADSRHYPYIFASGCKS